MTISADTTVLATQTDLSSKQDTLVSWTNIKTVNSNSLLGNGNISLNEVPSWWTNWDVLTNVNWTATWQAPSGWDVMVSSQPNNILTSWMKIRAGEQSDYEGLWTYDMNTVYLTIPDGSVQVINNNENLPNDAD
jgi:hypothetical protein